MNRFLFRINRFLITSLFVIPIFLFSQETQQNTMAIMSTIQVGNGQMEHTKMERKEATNAKIILFKKENETQIVKAMNKYYLFSNDSIMEWNEMICDFFGSNFHTLRKVNYYYF